MENLTLIVKWVTIIIVVPIAIYVIGRILSLSVFKSWFDAKKESEKEKR